MIFVRGLFEYGKRICFAIFDFFHFWNKLFEGPFRQNFGQPQLIKDI